MRVWKNHLFEQSMSVISAMPTSGHQGELVVKEATAWLGLAFNLPTKARFRVSEGTCARGLSWLGWAKWGVWPTTAPS